MPRIVYIATRYADAAHVETVIVPQLRAAGLGVVSSWHLPPHAPEDLSSMTAIDAIRAYGNNRAEVTAADVVLVIATDGARETFAEAEQAWHEGTPVVWVGRPHLSAMARAALGMWRLETDIGAAIAWMVGR